MMEKMVRFFLMTLLFISLQMVSVSFGQEQSKGIMLLKNQWSWPSYLTYSLNSNVSVFKTLTPTAIISGQ